MAIGDFVMLIRVFKKSSSSDKSTLHRQCRNILYISTKIEILLYNYL